MGEREVVCHRPRENGDDLYLFILPSLASAGEHQQFDDDIEYPVAHMAAYVVNWVSVIANPLIYVTSQERYREVRQ